MRRRVIILLLAGLAAPAVAQLGLPQVGQTVGQTVGGVAGAIDQTVDRTVDRVGNLDVAAPVRSVRELARDRLSRLDAFLKAHPAEIERDDTGVPARRGVVLLVDADPGTLDAVRKLGFEARPVQGLEALGLSSAELGVPVGMDLSAALKRLRAALPGKTFSSDPIHFPSGEAGGRAAAGSGAGANIRTSIGMIDGGVADAVPVSARRAFAKGGPSASDHGTAVASLMRKAGATQIAAADVYGQDPAGGSALAIAQALSWMTGDKIPVVSISLVGPPNPLLERAITAAGSRGMTIVAAVGNDGPAAPPAYPASYPNVIAVTGVDGRNRVLIEAGKALHLDYAAPGADMTALNARGRDWGVRGTSFAAPLVAARAAAAIDTGKDRNGLRATLDAEARDLGKKGPDATYGRGLLCGNCARR
ncbi:MAG: S8 family serine peptidase [Sphingobium sp.]|nr:S8 family serine peptidase [Sphingobium sp.]